jgi:SNF2 family DNA or RNA helicase
VQYVYAAQGQAASLSTFSRTDGSVDYQVNVRGRHHWLTLGGGHSDPDNAKLVPTPGGRKYCFTVPSGFLVLRRNGKIFCTGNTGKTLSALWAIDYLIRVGAVKRALVVTYKSIMRPAWSGDCGEHLPWMPHAVVYSTTAKSRRQKALNPAPLHVTNYETAETCHDQLLANQYDLVCIDESPAIKTHTTRRWRFLYPMVQQARYAWCLTGTPTAQAPTDAYGQVLMMYGERWGVSAERFKEMTMVRVAQNVWVPVNNANEVVFAAMQPAIKISKREVMPWMPEKTERMLDVDLSKAQTDAIAELKKAAATTLANGTKITSVHAAALRTKIVQIASGTVLDQNKVSHQVDYTPRFSELLRVVQEYRQSDDDHRQAPFNKVLVLCAFKATVDRVTQDLKAKGLKAVGVYSEVPLSQRNAWLGDSFNRTRDVEVVVAVPEILSHGLTLTSANLTVWFTPCDRAEVIIQAENRMDRPGQKNPMQVLRLSGCDVERKIFNRHFDRMETHNDFLAMYSQMVAAL